MSCDGNPDQGVEAILHFDKSVYMPDQIFENPRLAGIYDALDADRRDLDVYVAIAHELGARRVLDVGCGTGTLALLLAGAGFEVTGLDPAKGSLDVARGKPGAERVRWIHGTAPTLRQLRKVDLATMTGNVAQAISDELEWDATLRAVYDRLRPGGYLVFETRDPAFTGWDEWNRAASYRLTEVDGVGTVQSWVELVAIDGPLVSFQANWVFPDGDLLTSDSTLRFRERDEVHSQLVARGYLVVDVREAPDRPARELVFFARRPGRTTRRSGPA